MRRRHTNNWSAPEDYLRRTDRRVVRIGRVESRLAEGARRSLHVLVGQSPVVHLHTEGLEEPGHSLADRTGPEEGNPAGRSLAEGTACRGLT